jgi:dihydrofolate reductase
VVLSRTMKGSKPPNTTIIDGNLTEEINKLKHAAGKDIVIFGSPGAAHSLMAENLIDDYWLFINPVLLGQGIPLFKDIKATTSLRLLDSNVFSSGVVCLNYEHKRDR